jgi:catechol 2,3-dioxygenase-like lactoylglutathione lyase family enzyme
LHRIVALRMVTRDIDRLARFYGEVLGATADGDTIAIPADERALLGVGAARRRRLRIGGLTVALDRFDVEGRPYPDDADAADLRFQHFAVIVGDISSAFERALACGATPVSRGGPVTLPASSGGVTAAKLRDPEGHPFELLRVPATADTRWRGVAPNDLGVLGIDHSAISVADAARSQAFYRAAGLVAKGATINRGAAQIALDGLALESVDVVPLFPPVDTPHLELLGYHGVARRSAADAGIADVAATRLVWESDRAMLLRDPDGHLHQTVPAN